MRDDTKLRPARKRYGLPYICAQCGRESYWLRRENGVGLSAESQRMESIREFGMALCKYCKREAREGNEDDLERREQQD